MCFVHMVMKMKKDENLEVSSTSRQAGN